MRRLLFIVALLICGIATASAQQRPLITEDVDIIPPGSIRIEAGIDFMQGAKYTVSGITGDLTRVGVIGISFGMAPNVEFQIEGVAQNYVSINSRGPSAIPLDPVFRGGISSSAHCSRARFRAAAGAAFPRSAPSGTSRFTRS